VPRLRGWRPPCGRAWSGGITEEVQEDDEMFYPEFARRVVERIASSAFLGIV
jgi:hypothetical protein